MDEKPLKKGFTTGTCAAVAAKAAAVMLLRGEQVETLAVVTPKHTIAEMEIQHIHKETELVRCSVKKDAGDDPDVTHGTDVYATVCYLTQTEISEFQSSWYDSPEYPGIYLTGGEGIGQVTKAGLSCPVGKSAMNPVPRDMIWKAVSEICRLCAYEGKLLVTISIPKGRELAKKTFNPKLGIEGGLSVLGTSGIVEPMSEQALIETIRLEIRIKALAGQKDLLITPGNYGEAFIKEILGLSLINAVKCSNYIGDTLDMLVTEGIERILLVGHVGKLIKVAAGVKNTHSKYGDGRMVTLATYLEAEEASTPALKSQILQSNTTEEAVSYLITAKMEQTVMNQVAKDIKKQITGWTNGALKAEIVIFSNSHGILGVTEAAMTLSEQFT